MIDHNNLRERYLNTAMKFALSSATKGPLAAVEGGKRLASMVVRTGKPDLDPDYRKRKRRLWRGGGHMGGNNDMYNMTATQRSSYGMESTDEAFANLMERAPADAVYSQPKKPTMVKPATKAIAIRPTTALSTNVKKPASSNGWDKAKALGKGALVAYAGKKMIDHVRNKRNKRQDRRIGGRGSMGNNNPMGGMTASERARYEESTDIVFANLMENASYGDTSTLARKLKQRENRRKFHPMTEAFRGYNRYDDEEDNYYPAQPRKNTYKGKFKRFMRNEIDDIKDDITSFSKSIPDRVKNLKKKSLDDLGAISQGTYHRRGV